MGKRRKRESRSQQEKAGTQAPPGAETTRSFQPAPAAKRSRLQLALAGGLLALWLLALVVLVVLANR